MLQGQGAVQLGRGPPVRPDDRHRGRVASRTSIRPCASSRPGARPHRRAARAAGHRARHRQSTAGPSRSCPSPRARGPSARSRPTGRCSSTSPAARRGLAGRPPDDLAPSEDDAGRPCSAVCMQMLSPMMLGMSAGSMVGHLARRCVRPVRPADPAAAVATSCIVVAATSTASASDWSLPRRRPAAVGVPPGAHHPRRAAVPHVRAELEPLLADYVAGFQPNPDALERRARPPSTRPTPATMADLQQALGDPEVLLGAIAVARAARAAAPARRARRRRHRLRRPHASTRRPRARRLRPHASPKRCAGGGSRPTTSDVFVERLLGLTLTAAPGRAGPRLRRRRPRAAGRTTWPGCGTSAAELPTPAEVDAPGLWLARIDLTRTSHAARTGSSGQLGRGRPLGGGRRRRAERGCARGRCQLARLRFAAPGSYSLRSAIGSPDARHRLSALVRELHRILGQSMPQGKRK